MNSRSHGIYINNSIINKRIAPEELEYYLALGYVRGMKPRTAEEKQQSTEKRRKTCILKYGVDNPAKAEEVKEKYKSLMQEKYGVANAFQAESCKEKARETRFEKHGDQNYRNIEKAKMTKLENYGDPWYNNSDKNKSTLISHYGTLEDAYAQRQIKTNNTLIEKYGSIDEFYIQRNAIYNWESIVQKRHISMKNNGTYKLSMPEKLLIMYYKFIYGVDNIIEHYSTDSRYPFECDIYIKSEDKFIELDGNWTHGPKPYDPNDQECIDYLQLLQKKAKEKNSQFIKNAIYDWTVRDPIKREFMVKNNLNYIILKYVRQKHQGIYYYKYSNGLTLSTDKLTGDLVIIQEGLVKDEAAINIPGTDDGSKIELVEY